MQIHRWLGLLSGLVVCLVSLSGAVYTFEKELRLLVYADRLIVAPAESHPMRLDELLHIAERHLPAGQRISRVVIENRPDRSYLFRATKINPAGRTHWSYYAYYTRLYVNPYTGQVLAMEDGRNEFFSLVLAFHMNLLLGKTGEAIVLYSTLVFVAMLLTGFVLWLPRKRSLKQWLRGLRIKTCSGTKRLNYDLHNTLGFYALPILLLMALTGMVWGFDWMRQAVITMANGKPTPLPELPVSDTTARDSAADPALVFERFRQEHAEAAIYYVNIPATATGTINLSAYLHADNLFQRVQASFDQYTGKELRSQSFEQLDRGGKVVQLNYDLHTGTLYGWPTKLLALLAALIGSSLPITGFIIWCNRNRRKKRKVGNA